MPVKATVVPQGEPNLAESTFILNVSFESLQNTKRISQDSDVIQTEVDRTMLHLSKDLFDAPELNACWNFQNKLKLRIRSMSVPSFLRGGMYMVKVDVSEAVDDILLQAVEDFKPIVLAFANVVDARKKESKKRLGPAFVEGEFPTKEQVLEAFSISWQWLSMSTPTALKRINRAFYEREAAKADTALKSAVTDITNLLLAQTKQTMQHAIDALTPDADGKCKRFRLLPESIGKFVETFSFRNVVNHTELDAQVKRIAKLVDGVDSELLRTNDKLREDVMKGFTEVKDALDKVIVDKPRRFMDVEKK